jgi:DNA-binding MarR family transcriptional regulator
MTLSIILAMDKNSEPSPAQHLHHSGGEAHLLREVVRTSQAMMNGFSRAVGIPASRLALMREMFLASPDGVGTVKLARQLGIDAAAVTRLVKEMEAERLIVRRADSADGRRSYIRLSAKGIKTFEQLHNRGHELERAMSSVINAEDMAVAIKVLGSLRAFLENLG